jgi:predicted ATP-dependent serine protease
VPRLINAERRPAEDRAFATPTRTTKGNELPPSFPSDLPKLREDILNVGAGLVVIDPVMSYLDPDINSNNDQQVRRALMPLAMLAAETSAAIVLLRHLNKSTSSAARSIAAAGRSASSAWRAPA